MELVIKFFVDMTAAAAALLVLRLVSGPIPGGAIFLSNCVDLAGGHKVWGTVLFTSLQDSCFGHCATRNPR